MTQTQIQFENRKEALRFQLEMGAISEKFYAKSIKRLNLKNPYRTW